MSVPSQNMSTPDEWRETMHKAARLLAAAGGHLEEADRKALALAS